MATSRSKTTCLWRSALKSASALHEIHEKQLQLSCTAAVVANKTLCIHVTSAYVCWKSATSLNSCSRMQEHLQVSAETATAFPPLKPYCIVLLVTDIAGRLANNTQYANIYKLLQSAANNPNIVHIKTDSEHMCKMQPSTVTPTPGQNQSNTFQRLVNNSCCPFIVSKACSVSLLLYRLKALVSLSYVTLRQSGILCYTIL